MVDVPVVRVVQILRCNCGGDSRLPQLQLVEKAVDFPHVFLDKVVDMPVIVNDRVLHSAHRLFTWTFQLCNTDDRCSS